MGRFSTTAAIDLRSENIISNTLGFEMADPVRIKNEDSLSTYNSIPAMKDAVKYRLRRMGFGQSR